jgi:hypothetical protein
METKSRSLASEWYKRCGLRQSPIIAMNDMRSLALRHHRVMDVVGAAAYAFVSLGCALASTLTWEQIEELFIEEGGLFRAVMEDVPQSAKKRLVQIGSDLSSLLSSAAINSIEGTIVALRYSFLAYTSMSREISANSVRYMGSIAIVEDSMTQLFGRKVAVSLEEMRQHVGEVAGEYFIHSEDYMAEASDLGVRKEEANMMELVVGYMMACARGDVPLETQEEIYDEFFKEPMMEAEIHGAKA